MPISSLVVTSQPGQARHVKERLQGLSGVTVTDLRGEDLVVLTDTPSRKDDKQIWDRVEATSGVAGLSLVYHNFEDVEEMSS